MSRKPLSVRNSDNPSRRPPGGAGGDAKAKVKKVRSYFPILDRPTLVSQLNLILKDCVSSHGSAKLVEDDLKEPTPERAQMVYFLLLQYSFDVSIDGFTQTPFNPAHSFEHKELMDQFIYRIQFFRSMKKLMHTCLERDFLMKDFIAPESKRLCRHLSAFLNYTKYHHGIYSVDDTINKLVEEKEAFTEGYSREAKRNEELSKSLAAIQKQRSDERNLEQELEVQLSSQRQTMLELKSQEEFLKQQYQMVSEEKQRSDLKLAKLTKELDKVLVRVDDLMKQVVTSPIKLKANLAQLKQEVEAAVANSRETKELQGMWESLASQASHIPGGVLDAVGNNLETLADKVKQRNDLMRKYESKEEEMIRQSQIFQDNTHKLQNLQQHLRIVGEDTAYQEGPMSRSHNTQELQRDILLLQQEVRLKDMEDEKRVQDTEEMQIKITKRRETVKTLQMDMQELTDSLLKAFHAKVADYSASIKELGMDVFSSQQLAS